MSPPFLSAFDSENNKFKLLQLASFVFTQDHFRGHCSDWLLPVLDCRQFHIIRCEHYISNLAESCQFYSVLNHIIYGSDFQSAPCWFSGLNQNWFIQKTCCPSLNTTLALRRQSPTQWTETLLLSYIPHNQPYSRCVCMGSLWVFRFPPTVQRNDVSGTGLTGDSTFPIMGVWV